MVFGTKKLLQTNAEKMESNLLEKIEKERHTLH